MTATFTDQHATKLREYLKSHELSVGEGDEDSACTVAAINLAMTGKVHDKRPACMSAVVHGAVIILQDEIPDEMRNSARYKALVPHMAGTGMEREDERSAVLLNWMWDVVLPQLQDMADKRGFGAEWREMCQAKTRGAADAAAYAARPAAYAAYAARAAYVAAAADAARTAAYVAADAADAAAAAGFWEAVDLIGALERVVFLGEKQ